MIKPKPTLLFLENTLKETAACFQKARPNGPLPSWALSAPTTSVNFHSAHFLGLLLQADMKAAPPRSPGCAILGAVKLCLLDVRRSREPALLCERRFGRFPRRGSATSPDRLS